MKKTIGVAILGGTGYGASELLRFFTQDSEVKIVSVVSSSCAGQAVTDTHPHLSGFYDSPFADSIDFEDLLSHQQAVIFSALPHGQSAKEIMELFPKIHLNGIKLIDLSGDFRLQNQTEHERYYPESKVPQEIRQHFLYGLTELNREKIRTASFIANPGCFATACILALAPLAGSKIQGSMILDAKTGSSGSGRQLKETTHHPTRHANFFAYKPFTHQHDPEIFHALRDLAKSAKELEIALIPQSMPTVRGIFVTAYVNLQTASTQEKMTERFGSFYKESPFVRIKSDSPQLCNVVGTNFCDLSVCMKGTQVVIMLAIDNLGKGMAGQAIQNMNLMLGRDEKTGLWAPALRLI